MKEGRKVWLITGSSRGFGAELVTAVLESGDAVLATQLKSRSAWGRVRRRSACEEIYEI